MSDVRGTLKKLISQQNTELLLGRAPRGALGPLQAAPPVSAVSPSHSDKQ